MAQFGFGLNINETAQETGYDQYQTSLFESLGAVAKDNWNFNPVISLVISSALFSLLHFLNPNVNYLALLELFIGGIALGVSYIYTKNLWFPFAWHFSWNFFQVIFGFNVSGMDTYSLIEFEILEPNNLNGGDFGFEGSYLSIIFTLIIIYFLNNYYKKFKIKNPD